MWQISICWIKIHVIKSISAKVLGDYFTKLLKRIYIFKNNELKEIPRSSPTPTVKWFEENGLS